MSRGYGNVLEGRGTGDKVRLGGGFPVRNKDSQLFKGKIGSGPIRHRSKEKFAREKRAKARFVKI